MRTRVRSAKARFWLLSFVGLLSVGLIAGAMYADATRNANETRPSAAAERGQDYAHNFSKAFREAADQVLPSVVMISTSPSVPERSMKAKPPVLEDDEDSPFGDLFGQHPELRRFFKQMPMLPREMPEFRGSGTGSGVIIDESGLVLTNNHVVAGAGKITVRLTDGREFKASDVRTDPQSDLAILRIEGASGLRAARFGDSNATLVGDWVLALGEPFGLEGSVTAGIISAKGRGLGGMARGEFLQTDAAINPGNSGGPLVNLAGEVIGINTAIHSGSGGNQGIGFAVPSNTAKWVVEQLRTDGAVKRSYLGVVIQPVTHELAKQFGVGAREGVLVAEVQKNSPAAKAGLQTGDVIIDYAGTKVGRPQELQAVVERTRPGEQAKLIVLRDGKRMSIDVAPTTMQSEATASKTMKPAAPKTESSPLKELGIDAETLTTKVAEQLKVEATKGVVITEVEPDSLAAGAGLTAGSVITQANRKPVESIEDLRKAIKDQPLEKGLLLLVRSGEGSRFVVLQSEK